MSLANKTVLGVAWNFTEQLVRRGLGIVVTLLLARFLTPDDFGLVAMMAVFLALGTTIMESGLQQALIRLKVAQQVDLDTAFIANIALGSLSYLTLFFLAPFIADFYDQRVLIELIRVASLGIFVNSLRVVQVAVLSRSLNFKVLFLVNLPAALISGSVAVFLAFSGWGVWALVIQILLSSSLITILIWSKNIWRPSFGFSLVSLKTMYSFSYKLFLSGMLDTVFRNIYLIVIGKFFSASVAGIYFFADKIKELLVSQLVLSVQTVTYPALSTFQDDNLRLKSGFRKVISATTFIMFPVMSLLAALATPIFEYFLPKEWYPSAINLQLMLMASLLYPVHSINLNILTIKGRSDLFLYLEVLKKGMVLLILGVSFQYGVIGMLYGQIVSSVLAYIPNSYFSKQLIDYRVSEQLIDFLPGLALSGVIASIIYIIQFWINWPPLLEIILFGALGAVLYLAGSSLFKLAGYSLVKALYLEKLRKF
ncbi:MAG: lipopolysaccharide biosynthesis protein [Pseudohongiella sp.]|nr:lipopolysaccharide biosynthesis protein [Pseudohongiella sp.]